MELRETLSSIRPVGVEVSHQDAPEGFAGVNVSLEIHVYERLRRWILEGEYEPGSRLVETAIAQRLGVSRGPVREALKRLGHDGFIVVEPRRGASVASVSPAQALEIFEVRSALEALGAELAALRRTDDDLAAMQAAVDRGLLALDEQDSAGLTEGNAAFHQALARATHNHELLKLRIEHDNRFAWLLTKPSFQRLEGAWTEHAQLLAAIRERNSSRAANIARDHIGRTADAYRTYLGPESPPS